MFSGSLLRRTIDADLNKLRAFREFQRSKIPADEVSRSNLILFVTAMCQRSTRTITLVSVMHRWNALRGIIFAHGSGKELEICEMRRWQCQHEKRFIGGEFDDTGRNVSAF